MKSKILKVLVLLFLIIAFNVIFSNNAKAVELEVQTKERAVTLGKQFYIRVQIKYNTNHNATVEWYGDNNEEYIDAIGGGEGEDGECTTISNDNGVWVVDLAFQAKKVGTADVKIVTYTTGTWFGWEKDRKETTFTVTILPDLETAYQEEPAEGADAQTIKYFIASDVQYNGSKNLIKIAENNLAKIKKWKETIDKLIASDRNHYGQENQYGATKSTLDEIILNAESGEEIEDAIENNSAALEGQYDLLEQSNTRMLIANQKRTERNKKPFIDVLTDLDEYIPTQDISNADARKVEDMLSTVLTVISNVGTILSVLMLAIIGIKYMLGSVEEKAEYKKDLVPYLVGTVLLFGICAIIKILQSVGQAINGN